MEHFNILAIFEEFQRVDYTKYSGLGRVATLQAAKQLHVSAPVTADKITCTLIPGDGVGKHISKEKLFYYLHLSFINNVAKAENLIL